MTETATTPWRPRRPTRRARAGPREASTRPCRPRRRCCPLGEWLVRRGVISRAHLFAALDASYRHGCRLGDALVWLALVDRRLLEEELRRRDRAPPPAADPSGALTCPRPRPRPPAAPRPFPGGGEHDKSEL